MTPATGNCQGCLVPSKVLHSWQKNRQQLAGILGLVHADSVLTIPVHQQSFLSKVKSAKDRASELPPPACQGPQAGVGATESSHVDRIAATGLLEQTIASASTKVLGK